MSFQSQFYKSKIIFITLRSYLINIFSGWWTFFIDGKVRIFWKDQSNLRWRFWKILWRSQNMWTLCLSNFQIWGTLFSKIVSNFCWPHTMSIHKIQQVFIYKLCTLRFLLYVLVLLYVVVDFFFLLESIINTGKSQ